MRLGNRIAKLEELAHSNVTGYRLPDGTVKYIRSKNIYAAYLEACDGMDTPRARVMLAATECMNTGSGGRLHELAQSLQEIQ